MLFIRRSPNTPLNSPEVRLTSSRPWKLPESSSCSEIGEKKKADGRRDDLLARREVDLAYPQPQPDRCPQYRPQAKEHDTEVEYSLAASAVYPRRIRFGGMVPEDPQQSLGELNEPVQLGRTETNLAASAGPWRWIYSLVPRLFRLPRLHGLRSVSPCLRGELSDPIPQSPAPTSIPFLTSSAFAFPARSAATWRANSMAVPGPRLVKMLPSRTTAASCTVAPTSCASKPG
jgi:hypothetical protein